MKNRTLTELMEFDFNETVYHRLNTELHKGFVVGIYIGNTGAVLYDIMWSDLTVHSHSGAELTTNPYESLN